MTAGTTSSLYLSAFLGGFKKFAKNYANFVFGVEQNDKFSQTLSDLIRGKKAEGAKIRTGGHGFTQFDKDVRTAWGESKKVMLDSAGKEKSLWSVIKDSFKKFGPEWKAAKGFKKSFGVFWKRMPLIGNALMFIQEIPNLYKAYSQGGLMTGLGETLKVAGKLGVMTLAMAAGAAFGGPIGGIAGCFAGVWLADKILGKSYSDKKAEAEAEKNKVDGQTVAAVDPNQTQQTQQTQQDLNVAAQDATQIANPYAALGIDQNIIASMSPQDQAYFLQALQTQLTGANSTSTQTQSQTNAPNNTNIFAGQTNPNQSLFASSDSIFSPNYKRPEQINTSK